jgi:ribosomal protein S20
MIESSYSIKNPKESMPITKSAKKSLKVSRTKQALNRSKTATMEKALRLADAGSVNNVISLVDKAAKTGIMHANKAARIKSRLAKKFGTPKAEVKAVTKKVTAKPETKTAKPKTKKA